MVSHKFHYAFYFFMYYDLAHRLVGGFESLMLLSFLFGATHRYEEMERKSFMHSFSGINNLRVWLISVFKCCHSWLQNPENKGVGGAGKIIVLNVNSDFFLSSYRRKSLKENVGQVLLSPCSSRRAITKLQCLVLISNDGKRRVIGEKELGKCF